ncbi:hypothetical protein HNR46_003573 [Haloferula luteola]|uniref:Uncharacterized protein n=1 Tax=Haloferula luteola TaxID=595692 RepID=A0A840V4X1_9BACT|nr:hypothetical protein [Haloferula luteola]
MRFETQETWINLNVDDGSTRLVELEDGGQLIVKAALVGPLGRPAKTEEIEQGLPPHEANHSSSIFEWSSLASF